MSMTKLLKSANPYKASVSQDNLWAVGIDGIYRFGSDGTVSTTPLPSFKKIGAIQVSFDLPQIILVLTNVNQRLSVGGSAPILVPR